MKTIESPTNPHAAGKAAHTPTPYYVERPYGEPGIYIAAKINTGLIAKICPQDAGMFNVDKPVTDAATAEFVVRACNSHAALVEAVTDAEDCMGDAMSLIEAGEYQEAIDKLANAQNRARATIAQTGIAASIGLCFGCMFGLAV